MDANIAALNDEVLELRVRDREPRDFDHALRAAVTTESNSQAGKDTTSRSGDRGRRRYQDNHVRSVDVVESPKLDQLCGLFQDFL